MKPKQTPQRQMFTKEQLQAASMITLGVGGIMAMLTANIFSNGMAEPRYYIWWGLYSVGGLVYLIIVTKRRMSEGKRK